MATAARSYFSEGEVRAGRVQPVSQPNELQVLRSQLSFAVHVIDMGGLRSFLRSFVPSMLLGLKF